MRIWADLETKLPILIEVTSPNESVRVTCKDFQWDLPLDDGLFVVTEPQGYLKLNPSGQPNTPTAKIELPLGEGKTKVVSVALGQSAMDVHRLCKPAKVYADDDPWLIATAAGGGAYVFLFAAEGTAEEMRGQLDPRRGKLYAVLRYPTDAREKGRFLLPDTTSEKTYGDFVTMKVAFGPKKAKAATVVLGMSAVEVKRVFPSASDRTGANHVVVFGSVYGDDKYLLIFTPKDDGKTYDPKLDKLSEVIYGLSDKLDAVYLLPRNKRGKPVAAEYKKVLGINGGKSGTAK